MPHAISVKKRSSPTRDHVIDSSVTQSLTALKTSHGATSVSSATSVFSEAILAGMEKQGLKMIDAVRITGLSKAKLALISKGKAKFTFENIAAIESSIGMSVGQLALSASKNPDPAFVELINAWSAAGPQSKAHPARS